MSMSLANNVHVSDDPARLDGEPRHLGKEINSQKSPANRNPEIAEASGIYCHTNQIVGL